MKKSGIKPPEWATHINFEKVYGEWEAWWSKGPMEKVAAIVLLQTGSQKFEQVDEDDVTSLLETYGIGPLTRKPQVFPLLSKGISELTDEELWGDKGCKQHSPAQWGDGQCITNLK